MHLRPKGVGLPLKTTRILLMVQKSQGQPPVGCIKPCKSWDKHGSSWCFNPFEKYESNWNISPNFGVNINMKIAIFLLNTTKMVDFPWLCWFTGVYLKPGIFPTNLGENFGFRLCNAAGTSRHCNFWKRRRQQQGAVGFTRRGLCLFLVFFSLEWQVFWWFLVWVV